MFDSSLFRTLHKCIALLIAFSISYPSVAQQLDYADGSKQETVVVTKQQTDSPENEEASEEPSETATPLANLKITGQIRHRSEMHERFDVGASDIPRFHLLRTRLNVSFQPVDDILAFVQIQDSRLFGGQDPTLARGTLDGSADALDFHQAFFKVTDVFDTNFSLKVGRQELSYGNQRLIGAVGWHNVGRTFDAAVLSYEDKHRSVHVFTSQLVGTTALPTSQNLHGIYSTFHYFWTHHAEIFALIDNNRVELTTGPDMGNDRLHRYTFGGTLFGKQGAADYRIEVANQRGDIALTDSTARASIDAYLFSSELGFKLYAPANLRSSVMYTRLSGDSTPGDNTVNSFNTLFATNHKFYGFLDYYPRSYNTNGLQNVAFRLSGNAGDRLKVNADFHYFRLVEPAPLGEDMASTLGKEVDLTFAFKYNSNFSIGSGVSFYMADQLMENIIGDSSAWWFYLTTQVNF